MLTLAVLAASGCGGDSSVEPAPAEPEGTSEPTLVAALGDSITAGSPLWDPSPPVRDQLPGLDRRSQYEFWAAAELGPDARFRNCGVFGERTDQIATRLEECAAGADRLVVQGGINDIAQGRPVAQAAADLDAIVASGQDLELDPVIVEVLPWNNGYPDAAPLIRRLNSEIAAIGEPRSVPVLPFYEALEDPAARGRMRHALTIDGDHPSVAGYRRLGALVARALDGSR